MPQSLDIIITKVIQTKTSNQISETEIINHFYNYYYKINEIDAIYVNSDIYNNYYNVNGTYNVYIEIDANEVTQQAIIVINVNRSINIDLIIFAFLIVMIIAIKVSKKVKNCFTKWLN